MRNVRGVYQLIAFLFCFFWNFEGKTQNFSNMGKEFWVGYGTNSFFYTADANLNKQEMVLYLSAGDKPATVVVSVPGTNWSKSYTVPAHSAISTDPMPKNGAADMGADARLMDEGLYSKNIHIVSDVPIAVFVHTYGNYSSGGTTLLPVETYGYTYFSINPSQNYTNSYSFFYVIASEDNTVVRITPSLATKAGRARNVAFEVTLKKGESYNVLGALQTGDRGNDMSGSKIQSVPGTDGRCHPIAVFSGSSRAGLCMIIGNDYSGGDFIMQQVFPANAWGTQYLTAPTSTAIRPGLLNKNRYRVFIKQLGTRVYRNGNVVSGLQNNSFYEFDASGAEYITATGPIMVVQMIVSGFGCGSIGDGDPEMIYLSPVEQAINSVAFYSTNKEAIKKNYLTLIIPDNGLASLRIDGSTAYDSVYAHPGLAGYQVVIKELPLTPMQHTVASDSGFTGITYGLGVAESYGYNIGSYVDNLAAMPEIKPDNSNETYNYVCTKTPFHLSVKTIYQATSITLHFSRVTDIVPATDVTISNPIPSGTTIIKGKTYYIYDLPDSYVFTKGGEHVVPLSVTAPSIDNCSQSEILNITIPVHQGPGADFTAQSVCEGEEAAFTYVSKDADAGFSQWLFGDGTSSKVLAPVKKYEDGGTYQVTVQVVRDYDGCWGDTTKPLVIKSAPDVAFGLPARICMPGGEATFTNTTTVPGDANAAINWRWQFGDNGTATVKQPVYHYTTAGNYTVKLYAAAAGCADSLTFPLPASAFANTPVPDFTFSDTAFCSNSSGSLQDNSTYDKSLPATWTWQLGDGTTATGSSVTKNYTQAGLYNVAMVITAGGCTAEAVRKPVRVYNPPRVDAGAEVIISAGEKALLKAVVNEADAKIAWTPTDKLTGANTLQPVATPMLDQLYYVTATGKAGCSSTDSVWVRVYNDIRIPNVFTPNGDGVNDFWEIKGLQSYSRATLDIYNRYGQLVYRKTGGYGTPWNGTGTSGNLLPAGTYYYVLQPGANGYGKITGSVTIIR